MDAVIVSEPGMDGVFRYVEMLCRYLSDQGIGVHLAYSSRRGSDRLGQLVDWIERRGGRTLNLGVANRPEVGDCRAVLALLRLVREVRPAVVHSHSSKAGVLARVLRYLGCQAAQVYHPHAYVGMRPTPGRFDRVYNRIESWLGGLGCTIVVSTGEWNFARGRLRVPEHRMRMVPNGVDLERFAPIGEQAKRAIRSTLRLPANGAVLGLMARSCAQKDPATLYRAFARVARERPVWLLHVGKGELDRELDALVAKHQLQDRVRRVDYLTDPRDFYGAVDAFALASCYEGLSLAALEAMAANLPLILSDAQGNEDLLALPLTHCWSAPPGDVEAFVHAIDGWYDALQQRRVPNHRAIARERFELHRSFAAVVDVYRDLTGATVDWPATARVNRREVPVAPARLASAEFDSRRRPPESVRRR